ncbi:MAG: ladC, partial [Rariglobus sp.]|nr:ladC [Rariglobus sp.]
MTEVPNSAPDLFPDLDRSGRDALVSLPWWRRFDFKVAALVGCTALLIVIGVGVFAYRSIVDARLRSFENRLESLALSLSESIDADAVAGIPPPAGVDVFSPALHDLHRRLQRIVDQQADIDSIYILRATETPGRLSFLLDASKTSRVAQPGELYDATAMPFMLRGFERVSVEDRVYGDEFGQTQSSYAPLKTADGRVIGIVGVDVLALRLAETRWQVIRFCSAVFGLAIVAVLLLALVVRRQVQRPLARVLDAASAISEGKLDTRLHAPSRDEFGLLAGKFDTMARHLRDRERLRETFGLYVSRELATALMKDGQLPALGGVECVATVIFCDLSNYTRISEAFSPQEVIALINEYLAAMSPIIEAHQGCLLDFTGDGIIAGFGLPLPNLDHAHNAVQCAIEM